MHNPSSRPSCTEAWLSPACTALITVTEISSIGFFFENRRWGRVVAPGSQAVIDLGLSALAISFQDGPQKIYGCSSTPSVRCGGPHASGGRLATGCECLVGEGTLWTRRRQRAGLTDLKFRLVRESFADAVSWVAKNLPTRPAVPVLSGVLLTGSDDGLTISGFDYEVSAEAQVAAEIASPGSVLVSGRLLSDITRALPNKPIDFYVDGNRVALTCGSARFSLPTMAVEDYPTLPALPEETGALPAELFAEAISQVAIAAGRDDTLPMLTGIRVEISGDTVVLAATDRFRLAVRELTWSALSRRYRSRGAGAGQDVGRGRQSRHRRL